MATMTATRNFVTVAKVGELENGQMKAYKVGRRKILLARVADRYYAASSVCPHMGANLALGKLEGTILTCPRHASKFDLTRGQVIRWTDWTGVKRTLSKVFRPARPLPVYPVKIEGDSILIGI